MSYVLSGNSTPEGPLTLFQHSAVVCKQYLNTIYVYGWGKLRKTQKQFCGRKVFKKQVCNDQNPYILKYGSLSHFFWKDENFWIRICLDWKCSIPIKLLLKKFKHKIILDHLFLSFWQSQLYSAIPQGLRSEVGFSIQIRHYRMISCYILLFQYCLLSSKLLAYSLNQ